MLALELEDLWTRRCNDEAEIGRRGGERQERIGKEQACVKTDLSSVICRADVDEGLVYAAGHCERHRGQTVSAVP